MKKILLACIVVFSASFINAQSWNPYVAQGIISPSPLSTVQLKGTGVASFNVGNTGSNPLVYNPNIPDNNVKVIITLSLGVPNITPLNSATALKVIGGSWANMFKWVYNMTQNTFTGTQNQTIPELSQGSVTIQYKVNKNSPKTQPQNGFKVNLTPPSYINLTNSTSDDYVSSYTCTEAGDSGDKLK